MLQQEKSVNCNKHLKCHIKPLFNHYKKKNPRSIRDRFRRSIDHFKICDRRPDRESPNSQ